MKLSRHIFLLPLSVLCLSSCIKDDENVDYSEWKAQNTEYVAKMETLTENGEQVYTKFTPQWAPEQSVLLKWHNDRALTADNLQPLSTSTVDIKYEFEDIEGNKLGNSYSSAVYGDSIYRSHPNSNIVGMWTALINMHVGDSVTIVIPWQSAYGYRSVGDIKPYSTLIYHVKLKAIQAYEIN